MDNTPKTPENKIKMTPNNPPNPPKAANHQYVSVNNTDLNALQFPQNLEGSSTDSTNRNSLPTPNLKLKKTNSRGV